MNKKVLVTGATGFTGSHLCKSLVKEGHRVRALVRETSILTDLKELDLEITYGDVCDPASLTRAVDGIDIIYHLAAASLHRDVSEETFWKVNFDGTKNLLQAAEEKGIQRLIHCSTVGVLGDISNLPAKEDAPYNPGDIYQKSKCEGEKLALEFSYRKGLPVVVVRPTGIYGPGDKRFLKLFRSINRGRFVMLGIGDVLYHMTYIDDLVDGLKLCGEKESILGQIYTLGGNEYVSLNELVGRIAQILEVSEPWLRFPVWPVWMLGFACEIICQPLGFKPPLYRRRADFFRKSRAFDISKATRELGYKPRVDLESGLKMTANWYASQGLL